MGESQVRWNGTADQASPRSQRLSPSAPTQDRNKPSGACATNPSKPEQFEFSSLMPSIGGDRKYLGSYLRGDPQNTNLPDDVVPKTKYPVSEQYEPSTTPGVIPGVQKALSQSVGGGSAEAFGANAEAVRTTAAAATVERTTPLSGGRQRPLSRSDQRAQSLWQAHINRSRAGRRSLRRGGWWLFPEGHSDESPCC